MERKNSNENQNNRNNKIQMTGRQKNKETQIFRNLRTERELRQRRRAGGWVGHEEAVVLILHLQPQKYQVCGEPLWSENSSVLLQHTHTRMCTHVHMVLQPSHTHTHTRTQIVDRETKANPQTVTTECEAGWKREQSCPCSITPVFQRVPF